MKAFTRLLFLGVVGVMLTSVDAICAERGTRPGGSGSGNRAVQSSPNLSSSSRSAGVSKSTSQSVRQATGSASSANKSQATRPGNNGQPSFGNSQPGGNRPGNNGQGVQRPGNGGGQQPGMTTPPSGNGMQPGGNRPGNNGQGVQRPGTPTPPRPQGGNMGNNRPNRPGTPPPPVSNARPHRPSMPPAWQVWRPTPPPMSYRPYSSWPRFSTVLGIPFGATISVSLNTLFNLGYTVLSNYGNVVYVQNVPMMGYNWPEATLNYTSSGLLAGSEFVNYSLSPSTALYSSLFSRLCATYGSPYTQSGLSATWWGPSGQYIRLNYSNTFGANGMSYYYTTLNFGIY